jgi:hypothetical protein
MPLGSRVAAGAKTDGGNTTTTPGKPAVDDKEKHTRTEFIILVIWKEDTPSDSLRGSEGQGQLPPSTAPVQGGRGPGSR